MLNLTFDIITYKDFCNKLLEEYDDYLKNIYSSRLALNCALTAWHLIEWVYKSHNDCSEEGLKKYREEIMNICPSMKIMRDLSNGTKHYRLRQSPKEIKNTKLHQGSYSNDYSRDYDTQALIVELSDGRKVYFEDEIKTVIEFWSDHIN